MSQTQQTPMEESPGDYFAGSLTSEVGADLRLRGQNVWNVAQFFTGLVASLLTVALALVVGAIPSIAIQPGAAAAMAIGLVAALLSLGAWYTFVFECFHWARTRRVRESVLRAWRKARVSSAPQTITNSLEANVNLLVGRGSTPEEFRRLVTDSVPRSDRPKFLDGLRDEVLPSRGVRYGLRFVLLLLLVSTTAVSITGGLRLGLTLWGLTWPTIVISAIPASIVVFGWFLLLRSFADSGITRPDSQLLLFDLDKTLVDLAPNDSAWADCDKRVTELALNSGIPVREGMTVYQVYRESLQRKGNTSELTRDIARILDDQELAFVVSWGKPLPGLSRMAELYEAGHCLGLVTSNGRACVAALSSAGRFPQNLFTVVVSRDDVSDIKPSSEPLHKAWGLAQRLRPRLSSGWVRWG